MNRTSSTAEVDGPPEGQPSEAGSEVNAAERFAALVSQNLDFVWRTVRRLGVPASEADDASQQIFVIAHQKLAEIRMGSERAFLIAVATRVASRMRRTIQRREMAQQQLADTPDLHSPYPAQGVSRVEARDLLDRVLDTMPPEIRLVFVLFELEDLSVDNIAETLELPRGTVATRLRRARMLFAEASERIQEQRREGIV
jgi:RNA polymerase sigma-70 factor (ECF subfamily)